ncbi:hypothetical protein Vafri_13465 [Volvox africanus]|nr:hypothetical protein Vafri_13465 [Volvox africanus]
MPLPNVFTSCFRGPNEEPMVAFPSIEHNLLREPSQGYGATVVAAASGSCRYSCGSRNEDAWRPTGRNVPYIPSHTNERPRFSVELHQPSIQKQPEQRPNVEYTTADELVKDVQNLRWLGQGAQGVVYEGTWQGATVAVKFSIVGDLDATAYELMFSRLLSHPNVVQTFAAKVAVLDVKAIHPRAAGYSTEGFMSSSSTVQYSNEVKMAIRGSGSGSDGAAAGASTAVPRACSSKQTARAAGESPVAAAAAGSIPAVIARCSASSNCAAAAASGSGWKIATSDLASSASLVSSPCGTHAGGCCDTALGLQPQSEGLRQQQQLLRRMDSLQSDDGFGNPFGRKSTFNDVREVLATMGAQPGHFITQMVMEHCDHGSLHSAIQRGIFKPTSRWGPKLALRALIRTAREVAQGMFHLHSNSVLHGDLKPANVLLLNSRKDRRGYVAKVSDFGMAQFCTQDHISNVPWGTLVYMAPERLLQGQLFPASDVYSFGVILWEMYHGQRPYEGMHAAQIVMACAQGSSCLEWSKDSCSEVVRISRSCMAPSPRDRPTFEILMHELASLEAWVRMDGMRISKSFDAGSSKRSGRLSCDVNSTGHGRNRISCDMPKQRASLDVAVLPPSAARIVAIASNSAAAASASAAASSHHSSHVAGAPVCGETLPGGRVSVDTSCLTGSHLRLCHEQQQLAIGGSGDAGPSSHYQVTQAVPLPTKQTANTYVLAPAAGCMTGMTPAGAQSGGEDQDAMPCGGSCDVPPVNAGDAVCGRHSGGDSAAAIAAALAQQPSVATAVISELLALLQQQPQEQQQEPSRPQADRGMRDWMAGATGRQIGEIVGDGDFGRLVPTALLEDQPVPVSALTFCPATTSTRGPGCVQPPSHPASTSRAYQVSGIRYDAPSPASCVLQRPQRSSSCGDSILIGTAQAASADAGPAAAAVAAAAACFIARSSTDSVLESSGSACAHHGDAAAWGECVEVASMALSSPGPWVVGSCLAEAAAEAAADESPSPKAAAGVRDATAAAAAVQHRQLPQQCNHLGVAMSGASLTRRRSSNMLMSCRNINVAGWECTTITEEPT